MFLIFFMLWIILNGTVDAYVLTTGVVSAGGMTVFCHRVLGRGLYRDRFFLRRMGQELAYWGYLVLEIIRAALGIIRIIYRREIEIQPQLIYFQGGMRSAGGRAVLANSITLTAGTITVDVSDDTFCIHTLDRSMAAGIEDSAFARKLRRLEQ